LLCNVSLEMDVIVPEFGEHLLHGAVCQLLIEACSDSSVASKGRARFTAIEGDAQWAADPLDTLPVGEPSDGVWILWHGPYDTQAYGAAGGSIDSQVFTADAQPSPGEKCMSSLLTASGVPNDKGQLRWPPRLAILPAPGVDELCEQIESLFAEAARQAAGGPVNAALGEEMPQAVKQLRRLLLKETERFGMPLAVYQESERFLDKLDRVEQRLRTGIGTPARQRPLTEGSSTEIPVSRRS
jgi:hypothetical protein